MVNMKFFGALKKPKCSMGLEYLPTFVVDFYVKLVGKCSSPMEPMGNG